MALLVVVTATVRKVQQSPENLKSALKILILTLPPQTEYARDWPSRASR